MSAPLPVGDRWVVPGNRWDLLPEPAAPPEVTAVVVHYESPEQLALVLAGLDAQTHPAARLQVVVADDGSAQPPEVPPHVVLIRQDDRGFRAAAARNLGVTAADGEVLCFLDGDTVPEPSYVTNAAALPAVCDDALVVGRRRHADLAGWTPTRLQAWFAGREAAPRELVEPAWLVDGYRDSRDLLDVDPRSYRYVISAVMSCHRSLFDDVGGFDDSFAGYGGEDWEFAHRAFTAGAVLAHRADAVAWHDGPDWGEREGGTAAGREQKARETAVLAQLIPDHAARGEAFNATAPSLVAEIGGGTLAARVDSVGSLLAAYPDVLVLADPVTAARVGHPQVTAESVDRRIMQRIPFRLRAGEPVRFDGIADVVATAARKGAGRVVTTDGTVELTVSRALHRGARHAIAPARLFPVLSAPPFPRI